MPVDERHEITLKSMKTAIKVTSLDKELGFEMLSDLVNH